MLAISSRKQLEETGFFYFDNSISQSISSQNIDGLNLNKNLILDLVEGTNGNASFLTNDFSSTFNNLNIDDFSIELRNTQFSYFQPAVSSIFERIFDANSSGNRVFLLSDMQGWHINDLDMLRFDSLKEYYFVINELEDRKNVSIDTAFIGPNLNDNSSTLLTIKLSFSPTLLEGNIVTRLISNGRQIASVVNEVPSDVLVQFDVPNNSIDQFRIQLSGDEVEFDNTFFFSIQKRARPVVSLISNKRNRYLSKVFANSDLFEFRFFDNSEIDFEYLESSDFIIVNNLETIPNGVFRQLSGADILVIPSDSVDMSSYYEGLGVSLTKVLNDKRYEASMDMNNPIMKGLLESNQQNFSFPNGTNSYRFGDDVEKLIGLRNGDVFLAKLLNGNIYVLACPLDSEFTNLAEHSLFLPLMYQLAVGSVMDNNNIYFYPNELISVKTEFNDKPISLVGAGSEVIPDFSKGVDGITFRVPSSIQPGFYFLTQSDDTLGHIAINLHRGESQMKGISIAELEKFVDSQEHLKVVNVNNATINDLKNGASSGLWKYALVLALLFILTETLLHRYAK